MLPLDMIVRQPAPMGNRDDIYSPPAVLATAVAEGGALAGIPIRAGAGTVTRDRLAGVGGLRASCQ